ncbi:MAG: endonuclease/exonuclease/phosphatase family protein [bacterium]|nr:endonuclease/exonuclease/phosphatase family protein [bacterium]
MAPKGICLKLIQLNIWQGKLLKEVINFLEEQNADIVCLQEVFHSQPIGIFDIIDSLDKIQATLKYEHVYFEPTFSFDVSGTTVQFGNATLSKLPFNHKKVVFTNNDFHHVTNWADHPPNTRNALLIQVQIDEKPLTIINHHGYHEFDPLGSDASVAAMQKLVEELRVIDHPIIFAGDLNVVPASPVMRLFDNWLEDLTATNEVKDTLTQFGKVRDIPCDHVLITNDVKVNSFEVSEALVSDHKPLILEFELIQG